MNADQTYIKDIADRYVYDVVRRLPASQAKDVEQELRGLIEDMLNDRSAEPTRQDIDAVLMELGKPSELASRYRGSQRYLIGPDYFDLYLMVLKIVLPVTAFGLLIATVVGFVVTPPTNVWNTFGTWIASELGALMQAFCWVTVGFALAQKYNARPNRKRDDWKPGDLPRVPAEKARIPVSEPIAGIIFSVLALIVLNAVPQLLGVYILSDHTTTIVPLFDLAIWRERLVFIDILIFLGIAKEAFKLMSGKYTVRLAVQITIVNILSAVLALCLFVPQDIWNPNFLPALLSFPNVYLPDGWTLANSWELGRRVLILLIVLGNVLDSVVSFHKALRNREH